jgi:hypothetical protein
VYKVNIKFMKLFFSVFLAMLFYLHSPGQVISTYMGTGVADWGGDGGVSSIAEITFPFGLNFDNNGNLLVSHYCLVRSVDKLTTIVTRIAGNDTALGGPTGWGNGGPATCASVLQSKQTCQDEHGNYFIADTWSNQIRRVDVGTGIITAFAGTSDLGAIGDGGPATAARFNTLACLVLDTVLDRMYISDAFNYKVRVINMNTGIINTFAGTGVTGYTGDGGPATAARFGRVIGLCRDRYGNLYVGDWDNARIRKINIATGVVTTFAGSGVAGYDGDGGPAIAAKIRKPSGLFMDSCDNMYIGDEESHVVRRIDAVSGIITTIAGTGTSGFSGDGGPATAANLFRPAGVALDHSGNLFIADYSNHRIRKMTVLPVTPVATVQVTTTPNDTVCVGTAVTFTARIPGIAVPDYQWYKNGVPVGTSDSVYSYTPANGDSVRCVASIAICGVGTVIYYSNVVHMVVTPPVVPVITLSAVPAATVGATVTVNASVTSAGSSYSIDWYKNTVLFATTSVPVVTYVKAAGTDAIIAKVRPLGEDCHDTAWSVSITIAVSPVQALQPQATVVVEVYPNPATHSVAVEAAAGIKGITITNATGQVFDVPQAQMATNHHVLDIAHLPAGVYLLQVTDEYGNKVVKRVVKL